MHVALYFATVVGAVALLLMMPRPGYNPRKIGALLGAATLGGLWIVLHKLLRGGAQVTPLSVYYYIFSALAIGSAVRCITHTKPVYSAIWFVMVILSSAGMFLLLGAEFMAFAMIIIYGGAILVTYLFVIMLAAQAGDAQDLAAQPEYERVAREPVAAVAAGFLLLAVLATVLFDPLPPNNDLSVRAPSDREMLDRYLTHRPAARLAAELGDQHVPEIVHQQSQQLDNVEHVGFDLFRNHPLGLELAGIILLLSLVGAVVIARRKIDTDPEPETPGHPGT